MHDVLIIGGGVIGLSLAWELARNGSRVKVIDRGIPGREASWAGAGILPPASLSHAVHPYDHLRGLATHLHPQWARELLELTQIDNGFRRCGGLYLARLPGEAAALAAWGATARQEGIEVQQVQVDDLARLEPALSPGAAIGLRAAWLVPQEAQLRNPRHLQALTAACRASGVDLESNVEATAVQAVAGRITHIETNAGALRAGRYCFTGGAWTGQLLAKAGISLGVIPIRGQMVLFRSDRQVLSRIVNEGSRYLVPRDDGRLLAGSTEEEVGFDKQTTAAGLRDLMDFATQLVPILTAADVEQSWAGLRPGTFDGLPYMGRLPGLDNAFLAAGHFRSGLYLSPAVAVVMGQILRGEPPQIDLTPFGPLR